MTHFARGNSMNTKKNVPYKVTMILLVLAIASCFLGAYGGEVKTVFQKATNICLECIGIG